jgi:hypothetical protein
MAKFLEKTMFSLLIKKKNTKRKHERKKNQINIFHDLASLKNTKKIIYFFIFCMHYGFNNKFIKFMET